MCGKARPAPGAAQGHLHQGVVERQGVEIEEPFAQEFRHALQFQRVGGEHGDPLGSAALDHLLDELRTLYMRGHQAQQTDVARATRQLVEPATLDQPTCRQQVGEKPLTIGARIHHQQPSW
ncbi:hypothetical protein D3C78_1195230 [compost metagenome]